MKGYLTERNATLVGGFISAVLGITCIPTKYLDTLKIGHKIIYELIDANANA